MVSKLFRNVLFNKEDTSVDFNIMKDKTNLCYSFLIIKIFKNLIEQEIYLWENNL